MTRTSVVIRCYNEALHIGRLLAGIEQQTRIPDEVIVVDSGSSDRTVEIARQFGASVLAISPQDFTFGRSLNLGCRAATGDVIVVASAHIYPIFDDWLESLVAPLEGDAGVALSYGRQQGDHRTRFSEEQLFARWFPAVSAPRQDHPFCNNANAAVRRDVWESLPYDETLTGLEDLDWAKRATQRGYCLSYVAEAAVAHVHQERFQQVRNRYRREAIAHRRIFPEQRMTLLDAARYAAANIAGDYAQAFLQGKLVGNVIDIPRFRIAQFWGSYQGFHQRGPVATQLLRHFYYPAGLNRPREVADSSSGRRRIQYDEMSDRSAA
jgi:glycosyltransferase involved in cell wall biosynthesis